MKDLRHEILMMIKEYGINREIAEKEKVSLIDDYGFDSMQLVEFLTMIEEKYCLSFAEGEELLDMVDDMNSLIKYLEDKSN